jgi:cysteine desulfurase
MKKIYLDNAATTPVYEEVIAAIAESMRAVFGNPSSTHQYGRTAKASIENARKKIALQVGATASEIIFTSGGSEADNLILNNAVENLGVTRIITSQLEHHAVLNVVEQLKNQQKVAVQYVKTNEDGILDLVDLRALLSSEKDKTLVSLMLVNNEIGTILEVEKIGVICKEYKALFHTDAVQAVGHFDIDLDSLAVDFLAASAHKFHGPKGIGFAYFKKGFGVKPMLYGGAQEKGARAGTEAVSLIVGMEMALRQSLLNWKHDVSYIYDLKKRFIELLQEEIPLLKFNGASSDLKKTTVTILNVRLPKELPLLLFQLDMLGISVSGGSACQSGSNQGSHVLKSLLSPKHQMHTSLRFSFSKFTRWEDLQYVVSILKEKLSL